MQPLIGVVKNYEWGSTSAIPGILGETPDGAPQAEYWLGSHPAGPGLLPDGQLDLWLQQHPEDLGDTPYPGFEGQLPFLMKILAAAKPLSLQAHPSAEQARVGFEVENQAGIALDDPVRSFKDPHSKPEMLVALSQFEALTGFRAPAETIELFEGLGLDEAVLHPILGPLRSRNATDALAQVFLDCLTMDSSREETLAQVVSAAVKHLNDEDPDLRSFARLAVRLDEFYPNDPSLLAALLLNQVVLDPFQAIHVSDGILHSYIGGTGIEVMAASDNVLRGGLTAKHIDPKALADVVNFEPTEPVIVSPVPAGKGLWHYPHTDNEFELWRLSADLDTKIDLPATGKARVLLACTGKLICHCPGAAEIRL
jgi:mannose-6-phosphate isomerase